MAWTVYLKDPFDVAVEITNLVTIKRIVRLSRPDSVELNGQAEELNFTLGFTQVMLREDGVLKFNGRIWYADYQGDETDATVTIIAYDPMAYFPKRWVRDADGDLSKPTIITDNVTAPLIMQAAVQNSIDVDDPFGLEVGGFEISSYDVSGAPGDWPMTLDDLRILLLSTGKLDITVRPKDGLADGMFYETTMGLIDFWAGSYGTDRSATVELAWGASPFNIESIQMTQDVSTMSNQLWYLLGPKCDDQHWRGNVTKDDRTMAGNSLSSVSGLGSEPGTALGDRIIQSRTIYFPMMDIRIYDDISGNCYDDNNRLLNRKEAGGENFYRTMWQFIWQNEQWLRTVPRTLVTWQPVPDYELEFDIGDVITITAGPRLGGGFSGAQRVYEYTQDIDENGTVITSNIVTTDDQES